MDNDERYKQGKIYKVVCSETLDVYYGSTIQTLKQRLTMHKGKYNGCASKYFLEPIIELVEEYPCNSKLELEKRERYFIENFECVNKLVPTRTEKEWNKKYYNDNKEKMIERAKKYREENRELLNENRKKYYNKNLEKIKEKRKEKMICECGLEINKSSLSPHQKTKKHLNNLNNNINGNI